MLPEPIHIRGNLSSSRDCSYYTYCPKVCKKGEFLKILKIAHASNNVANCKLIPDLSITQCTGTNTFVFHRPLKQMVTISVTSSRNVLQSKIHAIPNSPLTFNNHLRFSSLYKTWISKDPFSKNRATKHHLNLISEL